MLRSMASSRSPVKSTTAAARPPSAISGRLAASNPGFAGALSLVNLRTGEAIMIVLWQSAEQAQRPLGANGTDVLAPLWRVAGTSPGDHRSASFWEVTVRV